MIKKFLVILMFLNVAFVKAQHNDPLITKDTLAQQKWVDSLLNKMTVEEKIGQLFKFAE